MTPHEAATTSQTKSSVYIWISLRRSQLHLLRLTSREGHGFSCLLQILYLFVSRLRSMISCRDGVVKSRINADS
ncbi:unnamed protein product [Cylicocyclus nassatus]|uniref:Uncharacterized protein n=1 Tax=Cylicocyclus nassatus TaxID=53992 RepID=A0AA36M815_CYLNA|nr:unnamed protein product [Cylicocyclus nassatus]